MLSITKDKSIRVSRSLLDKLVGTEGDCDEIPLAYICDYKERKYSPFFRRLTLYFIDNTSKVGGWTPVNKLGPITTFGLQKEKYQKIMSLINEVTDTYKQLGERRKQWFFSKAEQKEDIGAVQIS